MKYIRTKDGIFPCLDTNTLKVGDLVGINEPILAKSDTIEELCDEFVCESNEEDNDFFQTYKDKWSMLEDDFWTKYRKHYNFYAGIRIKGKGLIYVARLYEDGRFRLL